MSLLQCNFYSNILDMECSANIIMPVGLKGTAYTQRCTDIPVLYLLHGFTEDHTAWVRRTALERYVSGRNLAVIMPNVHRSFYIDMHCGGQYFKFISEELPCIMQNMFPISTKREDHFIAGLSMGGYGAFKTALSCPEQYAGAVSLSGAVDIRTVFEDGSHMKEVYAVFGDTILPENDLYYLAESITGTFPHLYQCCGTEDFLYEDNIKFRDFIQDKTPNYLYCEDKGAHTWEFWEKHIQYVLNWIDSICQNTKKEMSII